MRITSLSVEGVGKFGELTRVQGFGPGVNVLSAPNETGKSTLFRALRACLFERHSTKGGSVRSLATEGRDLPATVSVDFEQDGQCYALRKSFLRSAKASLCRNGVEVAQGREADEFVWRLLGLEPSSKSLDIAIFGLLWVAQGDSARPPEPVEEARNTLLAAIEAEIGAVAGDEQARRILEQVADEFKSLKTTRGPKAGSKLGDAEAALHRANAALDDAERRVESLDAHIERLQDLIARKAKLDDPGAQEERRRRLDEALERQQELDGAASKLREIEHAERSARELAETRARDRDRLRDLADSIDRDRTARAEVLQQVRPLETQKREAEKRSETLAAELVRVEADIEELDRRELRLQALADAREAEDKTDRLRKQLEELTVWSEKQSSNQAALAANPATREAFREIREVEIRLQVIQARLEAAASQVEIQLGPDGVGRVFLQGTPLAESATQAAVHPLEVRVGELATVRVTPAAGGDKAEAERAELAAQFRARLEAVGAADISQAEELREKREALETEGQEIRAMLSSLGAAQRPPAECIAQIRAEIESIAQQVQRALAEAQIEVLPTSVEVEADRNAIAEQRQSLRRQQAQLRADSPKLAQELRRIESLVNERRVELNTIDGRLTSNLGVLPDAERESMLARLAESANEAWGAHQAKAAALEEQRKKTPSPDEIEAARAEANRLRRESEAHTQELQRLDKEIHYLSGVIESTGGDGIGEKVEELREQKQQAEAEAQRWRNRAATLELLRDTLDDCLRQRRESLHAPLHRFLAPFLEDVFPASGLELGDRLSIQGLRREAPAAEAFETLSDGTQEQIAVLVRLAMGALLASQGRATPIILDDALMFSDDERIGRMFQALHRAGENQQVIVLTCRERTFAQLEGHRLSIVSGAG